MPIDCANCGEPTWYTPLLDTLNYRLQKLFNCWECLWKANEYTVLETMNIAYTDSRCNVFMIEHLE